MKNKFMAASSRWQAQHAELCLQESCFCQGKLPMLLSMCTRVHEQNIVQINGELCQSFVSLLSAEAVVLFWMLFIMHGIIAIFIFNERLSRI